MNITADYNFKNAPQNNKKSAPHREWTVIVIAVVTALTLFGVAAAVIYVQLQTHSPRSSWVQMEEFFASPMDELAYNYGMTLDRSRSSWGDFSLEWMSERQIEERIRASEAAGFDLRSDIARAVNSECRWIMVDDSLDLESVRLVAIFDNDSWAEEDSTVIGAYIEVNHSLILDLNTASSIAGFTQDGTVNFADVLAEERAALEVVTSEVQVEEVDLTVEPGLFSGLQLNGPEHTIIEYIAALAAGDVSRINERSAFPEKWLAPVDVERQRMSASILKDVDSLRISSVRDGSDDPFLQLEHAAEQFPEYSDISSYLVGLVFNEERNALTLSSFYVGKNEQGQWQVLILSDASLW